MMTTLSFNSVPSDPYSNQGGLNPEITRIKTLIETMGNYGVDKKYLFSAEDLYEAKNIPRVVRCLEEIEKLVRNFAFAFFKVYRVRHMFRDKHFPPCTLGQDVFLKT